MTEKVRLTRVRITRAQLIVEKVLQKNAFPITLDNLYKQVRKLLPRVAYSTIYRIIHRLEERRVVVKVDWKDRGSRFEWANRKHHHHLVCGKCNRVQDVSDEALSFDTRAISKTTGFLIDHHIIELAGTCKPCRTQK